LSYRGKRGWENTVEWFKCKPPIEVKAAVCVNKA